MRIGTQELVIILIIVILIFGPSQIPKLSRMFGKSMKSFKKGMSEGDEDSAGASETTNKDAEA
ncbi:MAG: twin-arginine translocase TatA/TatE family subunit [Lachnospiraceae bacterium]|nr:twin-arginine translocase TatA/TatE family subunit [Lachnospiraceae bacterium]MCD8125653.1 twin-arginine translocase TatA/TatE family subunit [Lachnospiraceae bacterium]